MNPAMPVPARRTIGAALAAAAATALLAAALRLAAAASAGLLGPLLGAVPFGDLVVGAPRLALGPLAFPAGRAVDDALAERLAADPRIRSLSPEVPLRVPARVEGNLFGHLYTSDVAVVGVDRRYLGLEESAFETPAPGAPVPVVFSGALLDLYNVSFAAANRLPRLSEAALVGRGFDLVLGESSIFGAGAAAPARRRARIVAFSRRPGLIGLALPRAFVVEANRAFGASAAPERLHVEAVSAEAAADLARSLRADGYAVETAQEAAEAARRLARAGAAAIALVALGTAGVAAFGIGAAAAATALERRLEADLLHLLARPRARIVLVLAGGTAAAGALGAAAGALLGAHAAGTVWDASLGALAGPIPPATAGPASAMAFAVVALASSLSAIAAAAGVVPRWKRR